MSVSTSGFFNLVASRAFLTPLSCAFFNTIHDWSQSCLNEFFYVHSPGHTRLNEFLTQVSAIL